MNEENNISDGFQLECREQMRGDKLVITQGG